MATVELTIHNTAPLFASPATDDAELTEGDTYTYSAKFIDIGDDEHVVEIDWGDGVTEIIELPAGVREFDASHVYADDDSQSDKDVRVQIIDDDGGIAEESFQVSVANAAPTVNIAADSTATEGTAVALAAVVTDPGTDTFSYEWHVLQDGEVIASDGSADWSFTPSNQGTYTVELEVTDDEDATTVAESWTVTVDNAPPVIDVDSVFIADDDGNEVTTIREGDSVALTGLFSDSGLDDAHTVTIDWGDGTVDVVSLAAGVHSIEGIAHQFIDNADRDITLTVQDEEDEGALTTELVISNVAPTARILDDGSDASRVRLTSDVFDPGILDTFDYSWSVSGTGIPQNLVTTQDSIEFDAPSDGFVEVSITVNDNDGGDDRVDTLFVGATSNASDVTIAPTSDPDDAPEDVTVTIDNETELISGDFAPGDYIILVGSSDNDEISIDDAVSTPVDIHGGDGDDVPIEYSLDSSKQARRHEGASIDRDSGDFVFTPSDDGTFVFKVVASGSDGNEDYRQVEVVVANARPRITSIESSASEPGSTDPGDTVEIAASFVDPGDDTHEATINWGDGTIEDVQIVDNTIQAAHVYDDPGAYYARLTVTDDDGASGLRFAITAITGIKQNGTLLEIVATENNDVISIIKDDDQLVVTGDFLSSDENDSGSVRFTAADIQRTAILVGEGDNIVSIAHSVETNDRIMALGGNDIIVTSNGLDVVLAGAGDDIIVGGSGCDLVAGGEGDDRFYGLDGDDFFFGGLGDDLFYGGNGNDRGYRHGQEGQESDNQGSLAAGPSEVRVLDVLPSAVEPYPS